MTHDYFGFFRKAISDDNTRISSLLIVYSYGNRAKITDSQVIESCFWKVQLHFVFIFNGIQEISIISSTNTPPWNC